MEINDTYEQFIDNKFCESFINIIVTLFHHKEKFYFTLEIIKHFYPTF